MTKNLDAVKIEEHLSRMSIEFRTGRSEKASSLYAMGRGGARTDDESIAGKRRGGDDGDQRTRKAKDWWERRGNTMVRLHLKERRALFTPVDVDMPEVKDYDVSVGTSRMTEGTYDDGTTFSICDDWTVLANAHGVMHKPWTGFTTLVNSEIQSNGQASVLGGAHYHE